MGHPLLCEEHIIAGLDALDREGAFRQIVDVLPVWILKGIGKKKVLELLAEREKFGTTAIGQGIALPHCFSPEAHEPVVAFGVSPKGIPYPSLDGRPVHFIFMLILPQNEAAQRQKRQILQNIKWALCDRYMQERLKAAGTASEVFQLIVPEPQRAPVFAV
jgi:mannitol/fructose-specific phosphotransferase system IIA component (Ntr-type)